MYMNARCMCMHDAHAMLMNQVFAVDESMARVLDSGRSARHEMRNIGTGSGTTSASGHDEL